MDEYLYHEDEWLDYDPQSESDPVIEEALQAPADWPYSDF
jgi:hypothetical protein